MKIFVQTCGKEIELGGVRVDVNSSLKDPVTLHSLAEIIDETGANNERSWIQVALTCPTTELDIDLIPIVSMAGLKDAFNKNVQAGIKFFWANGKFYCRRFRGEPCPHEVKT